MSAARRRSKPAARMPAEWEPHAATWLAWPHERSDWPGKFLPIPWVYGEIVRRLAPGERVRILVKDAAHEASAERILRRVGADLSSVDFFRFPTDRSWTRDFCPIYVKSAEGEVSITDWKFNGWAKYPNHLRDDAVPAKIAKVQRRRSVQPTWSATGRTSARRVVLEGGSIDVNGLGTLLTTEECLLSPIQARNPGMSREDVERCLGEHLGVTNVVWLGEGIEGDDTHGHVDDLARFVAADTIVLAQEDDAADANHARLLPNLDILRAARDQDGRPFRVVPMPMPDPVVLDGQRLPASYANFYIGNDVVLVPTFNDPADRVALGLLADLFPGRKVVGIHCVDFVWGLGTIHCATQQEPVEA
ncbi:MAG: agmatine deiminase family protein [Planctomycetes bacterium]|nr:agmatine deiminase family protein [Planctomycetota bacterium]